MEFLLEIVVGEKIWMPYGKRADQIDCSLEASQIYCVHTPELYTFCMNDWVARTYIRENTHKMDDTDVKYNEVLQRTEQRKMCSCGRGASPVLTKADGRFDTEIKVS